MVETEGIGNVSVRVEWEHAAGYAALVDSTTV